MPKSLLSLALLLGLASPALARDAEQSATPKQIKGLLACRAVSVPALRLACFDRETQSVAQAITSKNLVVIDRERVREARKGLFGFSVPSFGGLFAGDNDSEVKQLDGVVAAASRNAVTGWTVRLVDGSVWTQADGDTIALSPKRGNKVVIKRGALGSFRMAVNGQLGVRVKRIG